MAWGEADGGLSLKWPNVSIGSSFLAVQTKKTKTKTKDNDGEFSGDRKTESKLFSELKELTE